MTNLAGVVLCGGRSARMGLEKALLRVAGEPLVVRAARRLSSVADPVFLAPGVRGRLGPHLRWTEVADEVPDAGPLGGLAAALAASPHGLVAVAGVDMPFASPQLFGLLARLHGGEDVVVPVIDRGREPLHAVYSTASLPAARRALSEGRFALQALLDGLTVREVHEDEWLTADPEGRFAVNVNRVEDLSVLG